MSAPVREGDVLAGKYRIDKVLGVGGMGVVVAARHLELDERVAIKFLLPETLANAEAVARFAREARAAVKIKSEHVARVSDVGKLENGAPYMVMEYLDGGDLSAWLTQRGALPVDQAVDFVLQASEAIAEAHALGIVHRDLKPANLFVIRRADGLLSVKVLDFGISKATSLTGSGGDQSMTKTSALMGSPLYMSPEQMQSSKDVDARGDIWALGVILFELIAGDAPFLGETMPELILKVMSAPPQPLRNKRPDVPDGLEAVLHRCLEKDRGKRFQTVGEMAMALLPFGSKRAKASVERISGVMMTAGMTNSSIELPPSSEQNEHDALGAGTGLSFGGTSSGKSRGPWMAFGGIAVLALIGAVVMAQPKPSESGASATGVQGAPSATTATAPALPTTTPEVVEKPVVAPASAAPPITPAVAPIKPTSASRPPLPAHGVVRPTPEATPVAPQPAPVAPQTVQPAKPPLEPKPAPVVTPAAPKPNCNPSFYFDSQGNKHFKPECFH